MPWANGSPLIRLIWQSVHARLACEIAWEIQRLAMVQDQIAEIERERDAVPTSCEATERKRQLLLQLKSIGPAISALLSREVYYREFANRRQVGSFLGLTPSLYNSGEEERCQGISRAGSGRVRAIMIEAAWLWIRHQPRSALTRWFRRAIVRRADRRWAAGKIDTHKTADVRAILSPLKDFADAAGLAVLT
jgi:transposase